jgi:hypothetical protein
MQGRARHPVRGRGRQPACVGGGRRLAGARRCRFPKALLQRYRESAGRGAREDIAPVGAERRPGRLGRRLAAACSTGRICGRPCRANGAKWMVVEHDKPADPARTARACYA